MEEAIFGGLVGAVLTFAGQWYLGPRIDHRVRAQERWEQFLIELASLVDGPLERGRTATEEAWHRWHALHEVVAGRTDIDPIQVAEMNVSSRELFRSRLDEWCES